MSGKQQQQGMTPATRAALEAIDRKHGMDARVYDVRGVSNVTDFYIVATGATGPQIKAIVNELHVSLKEAQFGIGRKSGEPDSGWVALDYGDLVIHIFSPTTRSYYAIEDLWGRSTLVTPNRS